MIKRKRTFMKKEVKGLSLGIAINYTINYSLGFGIDPIIVFKCGYLIGIVVTTLINIVVGIIFIKLYDHYRNDLLLIEALKESQANKTHVPKNKIARFIVKWTEKNGALLLILLLLKDSIIIVLYFREGYYRFNGFPSTKIKILFLLSNLIINLAWTTFLYYGFSFYSYIASLF